jgi:DNA ligase (NAD+)
VYKRPAAKVPAPATLAEAFAALRGASAEDLQAISGVGAKVADAIRAYLNDESERVLMDKLVKAGVVPVLPAARVEVAAGPFADKTIVFTGTLEHRSREDAEALVRALGAKPSGSVSAKTDLLVAGPGAGTKLEKAKQLGVKVLDEEAFEAMLNSAKR